MSYIPLRPSLLNQNAELTKEGHQKNSDLECGSAIIHNVVLQKEGFAK